MPSIIITLALVFGGAGLVLLVLGIDAARGRRAAASTFSLILATFFVCLAALCGALMVGTQGYRALTHEEVAAVVQTKPTGLLSFEARFHFPDGREELYRLAGEELYIDAHILKWKPVVNILGVHTTYQLDRVAGRYTNVEDERANLRTVFSLSQSKPFDVFELRRRNPLLTPLVDAEYGSATFVTVDRPAEFEVRVSTTGLLIREVD